MDLKELLVRCRGGDELAWEALVRRYQGRVYGLALGYLRDPEEARDAAQEIFVRVYRKLSRFSDRESFLPWLLRLGRNICIDRIRRAKVRPSGSGVPLENAPEIFDPGPSPEGTLEEATRRRLVHRALRRLDERHREMILLKEIQGLKIEEIASILGVPVGTVKSRSNRARIELARAVLALDPDAGQFAG